MVGVSVPHIGEVVDRQRFFAVFCSAQATQHAQLSPKYYVSVDAIGAKDVPFGVSSIYLTPWGIYLQKPLILGRE
jgi:hypothetical protein